MRLRRVQAQSAPDETVVELPPKGVMGMSNPPASSMAVFKTTDKVSDSSLPCDFLPVNQSDLKQRRWQQCDIIIITGDAYIDHPSFGAAVISRVLENAGYKVGIIAQPDWRETKDFQALGRPRLFFGITSGNVDSMVANYTSNKKPRQSDDYSPGAKSGKRPDRPLIVYANRVRQIFGKIPIVLGGIEASLRRLAHYDYWDDKARRSILVDAKADILVYGMAERPIVEIAGRLNKGEAPDSLNDIKGTVINRRTIDFLSDFIALPSFEETAADKDKFNQSFSLVYRQQSPSRAKPLAQKHADRFVIQLPPALPLNTQELDKVYELPYARNWHPVYDREGGVPALETVRFSIVSHRGCPGECSFCSLSLHQGRIVQSRSENSILREVTGLTRQTYFRGTITDVGGPTANLYHASCPLWYNGDFCENHCLVPRKCKNLKLGFKESLRLYQKIKQLPGVKHVFIGSGFRYDLLTDSDADEYLAQTMRHHISGYLKVAPEHICGDVLSLMNKPGLDIYEDFLKKFEHFNKKMDKKCFLVNYFIVGHPGATLKDALALALYVKKKRISSEQIQDFMPLPMCLASCMYHTGKHPLTGQKVYVAREFKERKYQRALLQYRNPKNKQFVKEALQKLGAAGLLKDFQPEHSKSHPLPRKKRAQENFLRK